MAHGKWHELKRRRIQFHKVAGVENVLATVKPFLIRYVPLAFEKENVRRKTTKKCSQNINGDVLKGTYLKPQPPQC